MTFAPLPSPGSLTQVGRQQRPGLYAAAKLPRILRRRPDRLDRQCSAQGGGAFQRPPALDWSAPASTGSRAYTPVDQAVRVHRHGTRAGVDLPSMHDVLDLGRSPSSPPERSSGLGGQVALCWPIPSVATGWPRSRQAALYDIPSSIAPPACAMRHRSLKHRGRGGRLRCRDHSLPTVWGLTDQNGAGVWFARTAGPEAFIFFLFGGRRLRWREFSRRRRRRSSRRRCVPLRHLTTNPVASSGRAKRFSGGGFAAGCELGRQTDGLPCHAAAGGCVDFGAASQPVILNGDITSACRGRPAVWSRTC